MRYVPECKCKRCGKVFAPVHAAVTIQGLLEIMTRDVRSASSRTPELFVHNCDDQGKGIGELIGATTIADPAGARAIGGRETRAPGDSLPPTDD